MIFRTKRYRELKVWIKPSKYKKGEHIPGLCVEFKAGQVILDETDPKQLDIIKQLIEHKSFADADFIYVPVPTQTVIDGRHAMIEGLTLAQAIARAETMITNQSDQGVGSPAIHFLDEQEAKQVPEETGDPDDQIQMPQVVTGTATSSSFVPPPPRSGRRPTKSV
jgi:hypothetical protein